MGELFAKFMAGELDFAAISNEIKELYLAVRNADWMNAGISFLQSFLVYLPYAIMLGVSALVMLFGKKTISVWKFLGLFLLGYACSARYLVPILPEDLFVPAWVVSLVIGFLAAVLSKYLYIVLVGGVSVIAGYVLTIALAPQIPAIQGFMESGENNTMIVALGGGVVVALFVFLLLKWLEMLGTAAGGAWFFAHFLNTYFFCFTDLADIGTVWLPLVGETSMLFAIGAGILFLFGLLTQVKTRRRY